MKARKKLLSLVFSALLVVTTACAPGGGGGGGGDAGGQSGEFNAEQYFAGKTIRFIVTQSAGGGTDIQGRLIADELVKHIPGNPRVTVTNMPGKGGIESAYAAGADDLIFGVASQASELYTAPLNEQADVEPDKFRFIGAMGEEQRAVDGYGTVAETYTNLKDAFGKPGPEFVMAASIGVPGDVQNEAFFLPWLCNATKLACRFIPIADDGSADVDIMIQRGEVTFDATPLTVDFRNMLDVMREGKARVFLTYTEATEMKTLWPEGIQEAPPLKDVITAEQYEEFESMLPMVSSGGLGKNWFAGPAVSDDVLKVLQQAFDEVAADKTVMEKLAKLVSGGDQAFIEATAISGPDASQRYLDTVKLFDEQLPKYQEMQKQIYDQYWSRG